MVKVSQFYKILVVEDNLGDYVLLEEYISDHFLNVEFVNAKSYSEFVQILCKKNDFDIIFLDLTLPDKYGIELVEASIQLVDTCPIVVLTGYPDFNFAIQSLSLGASDYLLKEDLSTTTLYKCIVYSIERHKNILRIKDSEQYYQDLFQFSPNPLFVYDEQNKTILDVNNCAIETYQYNLEEFLSKKIGDLTVDNKTCKEIDEDLILFNKDPKFLLDNVECHEKKNGDLLYVTCNKNKIIYKEIPSIIISIEDLTKEIIYIQSIQQQNKKLKDIAWIQSHLVRAPLSRIMGLINLLSDLDIDNLDQRQILKMIRDSSHELDEIIRNIVDKTNDV